MQQQSAHALAKLPGLAATRIMVRTTNRSAFAVPHIRALCQDKATWRAIFRFLGVHTAALNALWRHLAHDWPALFRCNGNDELLVP